MASPFLFLGFLGYPIMWIFMIFFIIARASSAIDKSITGIICGGLYFLIIVSTYCKLSQNISLNTIIPASLHEIDQERLPSINKITIPEMEDSKTKPPSKRNSLEYTTMNPNLIAWNIFSGLFWTVFTMNTHGFVYVYIISCTVPVEYHIIFMVNIAFPVTFILICFTVISLNILYNLWVDSDFVADYLMKSQYKKMLFNLYIRLGWMFLVFAFISALLSSFCGIIQGDSSSTIVFILWMCLIAVALTMKLVRKYSKKVLKFFASKNN